MKVECTIAHISDLHNVTKDNDIVGRLMTFVSSVRPNIIVASGDLAEHPFFWQHLRSRQLLLDLAAEAGIKDPYTKIIVVPGNHDYGFWGNVGFSPMTGLSYKWIFRRWNKRCISVHNDLGVVFFQFDSNPLITDFARGKVRRSQFKNFRRELRSYSRDEKFKAMYKIAVVHHHPSPIIYAKKLEAFQELKNASKFLRVMAEQGVSLILHGHKHFASTSMLRLGLVEGGETEPMFREITVLSAGTTLKPEHEGPPGNHLNIIRLYQDGRVTAESAFARPGNDFRGTPDRTIPSVDSFLEKHLARKKQDSGVQVGRVVKSMVLNEEGDGKVWYRIKDVAALSNDVNSIKHKATVSSGSVGNLKVLQKRGSFHHKKTRISNKEMTIEIQFKSRQVPSEADPASYEITHESMNAFAMSRLEFRRKYPDRNDWTEHSGCSISYPTYSLSVQVQLPMTLRLDEPPFGYATCLNSDLPADWLKKLVDNNLYHDEHTNIISFTLRKPPSGYQYGIKWVLPEDQDQQTDSRLTLQLTAFNDALNRVRINHAALPTSKNINVLLDGLTGLVREEFNIGTGRSLELSIWHLDSTGTVPLLRQACGTMGLAFPVWDYSFEVGDGNMGRAFKRNTLRLYTNKYGTYPPPHPYLLGIDRNGRLQQEAHRVLWSIPMRHPLDNDLILAVLNVGTYEPLDQLVPSESNRIEFEKKLILLGAGCLQGVSRLLDIEFH